MFLHQRGFATVHHRNPRDRNDDILFHLHVTDYEGYEALVVDEHLQADGFEQGTRWVGADRIGGIVEPSEPLHRELLERRAVLSKLGDSLVSELVAATQLEAREAPAPDKDKHQSVVI